MALEAVAARMARIANALEGAGVRWCLLRGDPAPASDVEDVDLLVHPSDLPVARDTLAAIGFAMLPSWGRAAHRLAIGYDEAKDRWLRLDVVTRIAYGPGFAFDTGTAASCLDRCERSEGLPRLAPADRFWGIVLHLLLDRPGPMPSARRTHRLPSACPARKSRQR